MNGVYEKSNSIEKFNVCISSDVRKLFKDLREECTVTQLGVERLNNLLSKDFNVQAPPVNYAGKEPHRADYNGRVKSKKLGNYNLRTYNINLFKFTAKRNKERAAKSVLDTYLHEFVHHLDNVHLGFGASLHTAGFYKRIGWLKCELMK